MKFNHMHYNVPQFKNLWAGTSGSVLPHNICSTIASRREPDLEQTPRMVNLPQQSYASVPMTVATAGSYLLTEVYDQDALLTLSQDTLGASRIQPRKGYDSDFSHQRKPSYTQPIDATSTSYNPMGYAPRPVGSTCNLQPHRQSEGIRQLSQPNMTAEATRSFADTISASRGMIAMIQDITPQNIYGPGSGNQSGRGSNDYSTQATRSTSSSTSSASCTYPLYFSDSVDSSLSNYSGGASDLESVSWRALLRASSLHNKGIPPASRSMIGQFSSRASSSSQKKHKCKVCDNRFTRPSSLQTHMYSHTGEKPFSCKVEGCGLHFSVVSNLRRHIKVHKGDARSETGLNGRNSDR